jgi:hypothetical protein
MVLIACTAFLGYLIFGWLTLLANQDMPGSADNNEEPLTKGQARLAIGGAILFWPLVWPSLYVFMFIGWMRSKPHLHKDEC